MLKYVKRQGLGDSPWEVQGVAGAEAGAPSRKGWGSQAMGAAVPCPGVAAPAAEQPHRATACSWLASNLPAPNLI